MLLVAIAFNSVFGCSNVPGFYCDGMVCSYPGICDSGCCLNGFCGGCGEVFEWYYILAIAF